MGNYRTLFIKYTSLLNLITGFEMMTKDNLLKLIAEQGYNVGYGAKKHLSTYDIVIKMPGWVAFTSLIASIYTLFTPTLNQPWISAVFICITIGTIFIGFYSEKTDEYKKVGSELTTKQHELRFMYMAVKSLPENANFEKFIDELKLIQAYVLKINIEKQIFLSDWYAHYKFFWQSQTDWMDEQLEFRGIRDKLPLGVIVLITALVLFGITYLLEFLFNYYNICSQPN